MKKITSTFGNNIRMEISGGSHEPEMTLKIWGLPKGFNWNNAQLEPLLHKRQGGFSVTTPRKEQDNPQIIETNPLTIVVKNENCDSTEYNLKIPRPSHADYVAKVKYGDEVNMSGGGPFSGRMTVMMTIAGAIAKLYLQQKGIEVNAYVSSIGDHPYNSSNTSEDYKNQIDEIIKEGDSLGGVCSFQVTNLPIGLGGPMFQGLESKLASGLFGIPGVKGVDFGLGIKSSKVKGSENNDSFVLGENGQIKTATNNHGGMLGGITSGMPLTGKVYFKPTPSIAKKQQSINLENMEPATLEIHGRHDPCIAIRGCAVVEALVSFIIMDEYLDYERAHTPSLELSRAHIDALDNQIVALLQERFQESQTIGKLKASQQKEIQDKKREIELLEGLYKSFPNLPQESIDQIYEKILKISKNLQLK